MTNYRNITVDLVHGTRQIDICADAILTELTAAGGPILSSDLDHQLAVKGVNPLYKAVAIKGLRNMGYAIHAAKKRHMSTYQLTATPGEYEDWRRRIVNESYTTALTLARALAGALAANPMDLSLNATLRYAHLLGVGLGSDPAIGKTIPEVMAELAPLP